MGVKSDDQRGQGGSCSSCSKPYIAEGRPGQERGRRIEQEGRHGKAPRLRVRRVDPLVYIDTVTRQEGKTRGGRSRNASTKTHALRRRRRGAMQPMMKCGR